MRLAIFLMLPLLLKSAEPDRLSVLVAEMRRLTVAGDHAGVGLLMPAMVAELNKPHPHASSGWNQVGEYYHTHGDYAEAERAYQRGIRLTEEGGSSVVDLEDLLLNLATLYLSTRPAFSEVLCRRALRLAIEFHGPDSSNAGWATYVLGSCRLWQDDRKDARRYFQQAHNLTGSGCEADLRRGLVRASLGYLSFMEKKWGESRDSLLQVIAVIEKCLGPSHPDSVRAHVSLARVYEQLKQWTPAYASAARAREITEARLGPNHPILVEVLTTYASILGKTGRGREARDLRRRAKTIAAAQPKDAAAQAWVHVADLMPRGQRQAK